MMQPYWYFYFEWRLVDAYTEIIESKSWVYLGGSFDLAVINTLVESLFEFVKWVNFENVYVDLVPVNLR